MEFYYDHKYNIPEIAVFNSGEELLEDRGKKDIVFLDVEMQGISGINVGNIIKQDNPYSIIIIVTAFSDYLDAAMKFHVFRYISKPVNKDRLHRNLSDAIVEYNSLNRKICVSNKKNNYSILERDIVYIEVMGHSTCIHCINENIDTDWSIAKIRSELNDRCFYQSHRAYIINMVHVKSFTNSEIEMYHSNEKPILTRRKYEEFKRRYLFFLEGK